MSPGHHHAVPKKYPIGLKDEKPVPLQKPFCTETEKAMKDCFEATRGQYKCRYLIRLHNSCLWRVNYQLD